MDIFLDCACKSQDFAQNQEICAQSHDCETVTFRKSGATLSSLSSKSPHSLI